MAPKKKSPMSKTSGEETLSCRRSSLQVNLSFVSSLSDSGNGSLQGSKREITGVNERPVLRRSQSDYCGNGLSDVAEDTSLIACADQAAMSAIKEKEQALDQSCMLLKAAILNKTRELFDKKAELCVKTATVLSGQRQAFRKINDDSKLLRKKSVISESPPKTGSILKNRSPRRSPRSGPRSDSPILSRASSGDESFLLCGSNETYRNFASTKLSKKVLRVRLTRIEDPLLRKSLDSLQCSSLADDIGPPLTCSSFISDRGRPASQQAENDVSKIIKNGGADKSLDRAESPSHSLIPVEITTVQGSIPLTKNLASLRRSGRIARRSRSSVKDVPMEMTTVQCHIPFLGSAGSSKIARTSLNVNTSADEISYRLEKRNSVGAPPIPINDNSGVDCSVHVSLRVNTSLGTEESPVQETEIEDDSKTERSNINCTDKNTVDCRPNEDSTENISLIARLRNLSRRLRKSSKFDRVDRSSLVEGPGIRDDSKTESSNINCMDKEAVDRRADSDFTGNTSLRAGLRNLSARKSTDPVNSSKFGRVNQSSLGEEPEINDDSMTKRSNINCTDNIAVDRTADRDSTGNISLIERLRNLSGMRPIEPVHSSKLGRVDRSPLEEGPSYVEGTPFRRRRSSPGKESSLALGAPFLRRRSALGEEPSFVEGTPFPPSRSMLWKTQIRLGTAIRNRTERRKPPLDADLGSDTSLTPPNGTMVLDESPSRHTCSTSNPRIIPDSSDEDQPAETPRENVTIPNENATPNILRSGKKKLLSLQQNLELISLSPLSPAMMSPKKAITWKPKKKLQKRKAIRETAAKRIDVVREEEAENDSEPSFVSRINAQKENTKMKKPRKVISKKIVVKKIADLDIIERLKGNERTASGGESAIGDRSSINEFTKRRRLSIASRNLRAEKVVIVATGFAKCDVDLVKRVVRNLGGAEISSTVSRRTTHVVSTGVRTINLLCGIIRGCWLVSLDWVLKSSEHGKWLNAEQYEMVHFSKAVQENRRDRQLFGKAYVPELFATCGLIYIEHGSTPPPEILKELVKTAGGRITEDQRNAKFTVGPAGLREIWILDSITTGDLQPVEEYKRK